MGEIFESGLTEIETGDVVFYELDWPGGAGSITFELVNDGTTALTGLAIVLKPHEDSEWHVYMEDADFAAPDHPGLVWASVALWQLAASGEGAATIRIPGGVKVGFQAAGTNINVQVRDNRGGLDVVVHTGAVIGMTGTARRRADRGLLWLRPQAAEWTAGLRHSIGAMATPVTLAVTAETLYAAPILWPEPCRVDALGIQCTTSAVGALARIGLWATDYNTSNPGRLFLDAGEVDLSSTGFKIAILSTAITIPAGTWWAGLLVNVADTIVRAWGVENCYVFGLSTAFTPLTRARAADTVTYGALPDWYPDIGVTRTPSLGRPPAVLLRGA